ncbi:hypothetical protein T265_10986 [Opisthorchis viverrini]|uniref:Uncharacterized protein n=1 Tax=Opisthorchis viverrini TaxID=6198 RepID=A0A074Z0J7_OPIVI|nr:hypothetical protein T265_10986 [Opisthorchis viverrini]KER20473.1 hypothetical protein T265_10986 [Opisthorchis viverrini]
MDDHLKVLVASPSVSLCVQPVPPNNGGAVQCDASLESRCPVVPSRMSATVCQTPTFVMNPSVFAQGLFGLTTTANVFHSVWRDHALHIQRVVEMRLFGRRRENGGLTDDLRFGLQEIVAN